VARHDNLEFLSDIVPRTVPYKEIKQKKAAKTNGISAGETQTTLDQHPSNGTNGLSLHGVNGTPDEESVLSDPNAQLALEARASTNEATNGNDESEDVEMN
jgi:DNA polymerase epsilon subunit 4